MSAARYGQFGPVDMPISRPQQLTIEQAMGDGLQLSAASHREAAPEPAVDGLPGQAEQLGNGSLPASGEKSILEGGTVSGHVDIVPSQSAKCQSDATGSVIKLGMDVWKHIEDELHRRRQKPAWLVKKLDLSRQVVSGWKKRGVPAARYEQIAELFGWSLDRLVTGIDDTPEPEPAPAPAAPATPQPVAVESLYSPMALDVARMIDRIPDIEQKRRAYALILQITAMDNAPSPIVPAPQPAATDLSPTPAPSRAK